MSWEQARRLSGNPWPDKRLREAVGVRQGPYRSYGILVSGGSRHYRFEMAAGLRNMGRTHCAPGCALNLTLMKGIQCSDETLTLGAELAGRKMPVKRSID